MSFVKGIVNMGKCRASKELDGVELNPHKSPEKAEEAFCRFKKEGCSPGESALYTAPDSVQGLRFAEICGGAGEERVRPLLDTVTVP